MFKTSKKHFATFLTFALCLIGISAIASAKPALFFSDLSDGPTTGWENSATKGAAVSIWGANLGESRGKSYVTCGGIALKKATDYAEWAATKNPTTARGMQRITFWLNSSMAVGQTTIAVTTADGKSNTIPFYCRKLGANHIYFVATDGNDSYDGQYTSHTSGNHGPKANPGWCRANFNAGDIGYLRAGTWTTFDNAAPLPTTPKTTISFRAANGVDCFKNGTANKSMTIASYPGEAAIIDTHGLGGGSHCIEYLRANGRWEYWTLSKLSMVSFMMCIVVDPESAGTSHIRIVGNDLTTKLNLGGGLPIEYGGFGSTGTDLLTINGNYFHDVSQDFHGQGMTSGTYTGRAYSIYLESNGSADTVELGWNEFAYIPMGRAFQIYGHKRTDNITNLYFHDNYMHDFGYSGGVIGGGDDEPYKFIKNAYIYNNIWKKTFSNPDWHGTTEWPCLQLATSGASGGNYYFYNNVFYRDDTEAKNRTSLIQVGVLDSLVFKNNIFYGAPNHSNYISDGRITSTIGDHNIYYGCGVGTAPSWDKSTLTNNDPKFVNPSLTTWSDFKLQSDSPAINAGTNPAAYVLTDFLGVSRSQKPTFDIGAFCASR